MHVYFNYGKHTSHRIDRSAVVNASPLCASCLQSPALRKPRHCLLDATWLPLPPDLSPSPPCLLAVPVAPAASGDCPQHTVGPVVGGRLIPEFLAPPV